MFVARAASVAGAAVPDLIVRKGKGHGWPEMVDEDWPLLRAWFGEHLLGGRRVPRISRAG